MKYKDSVSQNLEVGLGKPLKNTPHTEAAPPGTARTNLGERLLQIREQIVASGETLLSWNELESSIAERRGEVGRQG